MLTKSCFLCIDFGNESLLLPAALLFVCSLPFISSADSSFSLPEIAVRHLSCVLLLTGCFVRKVLKKETLLLECPLRFSLHYWFLLLCSISTASLFKVNLTVDSLMNTESVPNGLMQLDINKESVIWIHASLRWGSISVISCLSVKVWINSVLSQNSSLAATSSKWMSLHYRLLHSSKDIRFGVDCGFNWIPIRLCATHLVSFSDSVFLEFQIILPKLLSRGICFCQKGLQSHRQTEKSSIIRQNDDEKKASPSSSKEAEEM